MRLLKFTALAGMSILLIALFIGCGSDDKPTTTTPTYGNNNNPDFVPVQEEINDLLVEIVGDMLNGLDNLYVIPGDTVSARADLTPSWLERIYHIFRVTWMHRIDTLCRFCRWFHGS